MVLVSFGQFRKTRDFMSALLVYAQTSHPPAENSDGTIAILLFHLDISANRIWHVIPRMRSKGAVVFNVVLSEYSTSYLHTNEANIHIKLNED